jgi:hypothetical protein
MEELIKFIAPIFSGAALLMLGILVRRLTTIDDKIGRIHDRMTTVEVDIKQRISVLETKAYRGDR